MSIVSKLSPHSDRREQYTRRPEDLAGAVGREIGLRRDLRAAVWLWSSRVAELHSPHAARQRCAICASSVSSAFSVSSLYRPPSRNPTGAVRQELARLCNGERWLSIGRVSSELPRALPSHALHSPHTAGAPALSAGRSPRRPSGRDPVMPPVLSSISSSRSRRRRPHRWAPQSAHDSLSSFSRRSARRRQRAIGQQLFSIEFRPRERSRDLGERQVLSQSVLGLGAELGASQGAVVELLQDLVRYYKV